MKRNIAATFRPALRAQKTRAKPETLRTATEEKLEKKMCGWVVMGVRVGMWVVVGRGWFLRLHSL